MPTPDEVVADFDGVLEPDGVYDEVRLRGDDVVRADAEGSRFLDCVLDTCDLTEAKLGRTHWVDTRLDRPRGVGTDLSDASLQDVEVSGARLGACAAYGSNWLRVTVRGGKLDFLNLRAATLTDVRFEDCVLVEPDFAGARLKGVTFSGCVLERPEWSNATLTKVDLSEARLLAPQGLTSLRGATVSRVQLIELADAFADQLGIAVRD
ncbi:MAG: pentapeptide repeat-containing protein [Actinomycetota bacterium]|nr:pentapeptide repeat-containing protein [Actinomycetota bacterium]